METVPQEEANMKSDDDKTISDSISPMGLETPGLTSSNPAGPKAVKTGSDTGMESASTKDIESTGRTLPVAQRTKVEIDSEEEVDVISEHQTIVESTSVVEVDSTDFISSNPADPVAGESAGAKVMESVDPSYMKSAEPPISSGPAGSSMKGSVNDEDTESVISSAEDCSASAGADFGTRMTNGPVDRTAANPEDRKKEKINKNSVWKRVKRASLRLFNWCGSK